MRVLITGGTGVLGRAFRPVAEEAGHDVLAPGRARLDLFDPAAVAAVVRDVDAAAHLATRIQALDTMGQPQLWRENDRLRTSRTYSPSSASPHASSLPPR
jgi:dTDP-4-dehydrorhamnose reductase